MTVAQAPLSAGKPNSPADAYDAAALNAHLARMFNLHEHAESDRDEVECFIHCCFSAAYGAKIQRFMPRLLSLRAKGGDRIAAFGLRDAAQNSLFLEHYLDHPIEVTLRNRLRQPVRREEVVEVGNLSALYPGAARWLIVALTAMLYGKGYRWVVFTGTNTLRNGFHRLGLRPVELGAATLTHLPVEERADWGSYYDHAPMVLAGNIAHGYRSLLQQRDLSALLRSAIGTIDDGQHA